MAIALHVRVLDLDGTISDDRWRLPLIDLTADDPWHRYHNVCQHDPYINRHLTAYHSLVIVTSRPERLRHETHTWLQAHGIAYLALLMRPDACRCESSALKPRLLTRYRAQSPISLESIHDNDPAVLAGYRAVFPEIRLCLVS